MANRTTWIVAMDTLLDAINDKLGEGVISDELHGACVEVIELARSSIDNVDEPVGLADSATYDDNGCLIDEEVSDGS